jgi:hypothetical protein
MHKAHNYRCDVIHHTVLFTQPAPEGFVNKLYSISAQHSTGQRRSAGNCMNGHQLSQVMTTDVTRAVLALHSMMMTA